MSVETVLWRRLDRVGHESARLALSGSLWHLSGTAVLIHENEPCRLDYVVVCDHGFRTSRATVTGFLGRTTIDLELRARDGRWWLGETERSEVSGAIDLDLNFSPSTNVLPIRRLSLSVGEEAPVRAAWLRFPSFDLAPLDQSYRRVGPSTYRYESGTGFATEIQVFGSGLASLYPGLAEAEASSESGGFS